VSVEGVKRIENRLDAGWVHEITRVNGMHHLIEVVSVALKLLEQGGVGDGGDAHLAVIDLDADEVGEGQIKAARLLLPLGLLGRRGSDVDVVGFGAPAVRLTGLGVSPTSGSCADICPHNCPSGYDAEMSNG
jgi:hypothetical protein